MMVGLRPDEHGPPAAAPNHSSHLRRKDGPCQPCWRS